MRRMLVCFLLILFSPVSLKAGIHDVVKGSYTVNGVCDQCKKRIEDAAYTKGVKYADWDVDTHRLTLKYDSSKISYSSVLQRIARVGHDNEFVKATEEDYSKLPSCCKYRAGLKKH